MRTSRFALLLVLTGVALATPVVSRPVLTAAGPAGTMVELNGTWRFALDRGGKGIEESWWRRRLAGSASLPGTLTGQGIGDPVTLATPWIGQIVDRSFFTEPEYEAYRQQGRIRVPFWLQPERYYSGAAWYQSDIDIPADWEGRRIVLKLERPHWQTLVALDGTVVGSNDSLSTPHEYDLGTRLVRGPHVLTIRVDNSLVVDIGVNSHSISDHTQGNWNGIVGRMTIEAAAPVWIDDLQVFPDVPGKAVRVVGRIGNVTGRAGQGQVRLAAQRTDAATADAVPPLLVPVSWNAAGGAFEARYLLGAGAVTWDEFSPALYRLSASLPDAGSAKTVTFGLRDIGTAGTQFTVNGRRTFLRGTLECAIFPKTGHPPTDVASWERILRIAKAHGLNHLRFHSWCPPEAAFEAADRVGVYYYVEAASWANQSTRLGVGLPVDDWVRRETDRILRAYGNHPSFVLMSQGNEPGGRDTEYLARWVTDNRVRDPRRLYTGAAGWPQIPENQFHVAPDPRVQAWGAGLTSRINAKPPETRTDYRDYIAARPVPVVSHEIGQWCVYPKLDEVAKYTGYLKAKNFEIFAERLRAHHLEGQASDFLMASGKLQTLCYKEDIESALRTPGMAGFELLDLHDFPGQGTALVGVLDPFWDSKGYVTPDAYRRFAGPTVPLARLDCRVFTTADILTADIEVAHFGAAPIERVAARWRLAGESGLVAAEGVLPVTTIPVGTGTLLGHLRIPLGRLPAPRRYSLVVSVPGGENDWDVWVYPPRVDVSARGVLVTPGLDDAALQRLSSGGRVLLTIPPDRVRNDEARPVKLGFSSIFWNTAWTGRQAPTTLGVLVDPAHPAFRAFPTEFCSNWQWWYLVTRAGAMIVDALPADLRPIVQVIDDWFTARKLALAFEARVNGGRLLVTSIDLERGIDQNIVARQFRASLLEYARSERFAPTVTLTPEQVRSLTK
jgi:hypothetical protein